MKEKQGKKRGINMHGDKSKTIGVKWNGSTGKREGLVHWGHTFGAACTMLTALQIMGLFTSCCRSQAFTRFFPKIETKKKVRKKFKNFLF